MKIAITGTDEERRALVNNVLFPALMRPENYDYGFEIREDGLLTAHRNGVPMLRVSTFTHPQLAVEWLRTPP